LMTTQIYKKFDEILYVKVIFLWGFREREKISSNKTLKRLKTMGF